jgi:hypothetical protein
VASHLVAPGGTAQVRVNIAPPTGSNAYAVEEKVPAGWKVSEVSDGGTFDAASGLIRWGVFLDSNGRTFASSLTAPSGTAAVGKLAGTVSVDGATRASTGATGVAANDGTTAVRLLSQLDSAGGVRVQVSTAPGQMGVIEASTDLVNWTEFQPVHAVDGTVHLVDPAAGESGFRFYRFRTE